MSVVVLTPDEVGLLRLLDGEPEGREACDAAMTVGASYDEVSRLVKLGLIGRRVVQAAGEAPAHAVLSILPAGKQTLLQLPKVR